MSWWLQSIRWQAFRCVNVVVRACRRAAGRGEMVTVRRQGLNWRLDLSETIDFSIYLSGTFQSEVVAALVGLIREGDTVLDIGANIGAMALPAAQAVGPSGKVVCFEPTVFGVEKLRTNLALNPDLVGHVDVRQVQLVDRADAAMPAGLYARWPMGHAAGRHAGHYGVAASCAGAASMTLDDACAALGLSRIAVIKLDVDGNECRVLRGGRGVLATSRPAMIVELQPSAFGPREPDRFEDFIDILRGARYRLQDVSRRPLPLDAAALRRHLPGDKVLNAFALPGGPP